VSGNRRERDSSSLTAFESTFGSLGTIPFVNLDFNQVLPPLTFTVWLVTIVNGLFKGVCKMPRLDGQLHKTQDIMDEAKLIVHVERHRYEKSRAQSQAFRSRQAMLQSGSAEQLDNTMAGQATAVVNGAVQGTVNVVSGAVQGTARTWNSALKTIKNTTGVEMGILGMGGGGDEQKGLAGHDSCALAAAENDRSGTAADVKIEVASFTSVPNGAGRNGTTHGSAAPGWSEVLKGAKGRATSGGGACVEDGRVGGVGGSNARVNGGEKEKKGCDIVCVCARARIVHVLSLHLYPFF
jgi:hypothetical protein